MLLQPFILVVSAVLNEALFKGDIMPENCNEEFLNLQDVIININC